MYKRQVLHDGIAPDNGVAGLVLEASEHVGIEGGIDFALEGLPVGDKACGLGGAVEVFVVKSLDDGFAIMEFVRIGNVVEEEKEIVGGSGGVFVLLGKGWRVLAGEA